MQFQLDTIADAIYIKLSRGKVAKTKNNGDHLADYDKKGKLIGFEILNFSKIVSENRVAFPEVASSNNNGSK